MRLLAGATTWLRRIVDIVLVGVVVAVLITVALGKLVPLTGRQSIIIGGSSMEPVIPLGSAVVVTPVEPSTLTVGDVVSMKIGEATTTYTHRIVTVVDRPDGRWIRTKGDANAALDPTLVPATAVIGRVDVALPIFGYLLALMSLPVGMLFVLGLAATLLAIAWLLESLEPPKVVRVRRPIAPRPTTPHALVARSLTAVHEPRLMLLPSSGSSTLLLVAPGARTLLTADPAGPMPRNGVSVPHPIHRDEAARVRASRSHEARRRFLLRD